MVKLKNPLLSFGAIGRLGSGLTFLRRRGQNIAEKTPVLKDVATPAQLFNRHMYSKCAALWHTLSREEQAEWNALASTRHMPGFAYWQSMCLKPNPGIYLPLQGGTMQGDIDMAGYRVLALDDPVDGQEPVTRDYFWANLPAGGYNEGAKVTHSESQTAPSKEMYTLIFDTELWDSDGIHDNVTNNSRLTCRTAGKYLVSCNVAVGDTPISFTQLMFRVNEEATGRIYRRSFNATVAAMMLGMSGLIALDVGDFVELDIYNDSDGANLLDAYAYAPFFAMQRIAL